MVNKALIKDDLYMAVNGDWLETAVIPDDKHSTGGFSDLREDMEKLLMEEIDVLSADKSKLDSDKIIEMTRFYDLATDFKTRDELGAKPIKSYLSKLRSLKNYEDFKKICYEWSINRFALPFTFYVYSDMGNSSKYVLYLNRADLILPDKTYYTEEHPDRERLLNVYKEMSIELLRHCELEDPEKIVNLAVEFDKLLAMHSKSSEELADYTASYNPRNMEEVDAYMKEMEFPKLVENLLGKKTDVVIVDEPKYFEALSQILSQENFEKLKAWLIVTFVIGTSALLSEQMYQIASRYELAISGNPKAQSPKKFAFYHTIGFYNHVMGDYYGRKYFGEKAKQDVKKMVFSLIDVYKQRLSENDWLGKSTISKAIEKLDHMEVLVGYPDVIAPLYDRYKVKEYGEFEFFNNSCTFTQIRSKHNYEKFGTDVDRREWHMSADTVNAYFDPMNNLICFPAAILQAPFYSIEQSPSQNFGGIGAVIAHEISHAFDNNGAKFDKNGNLNNWWSDEDFRAFDQKAQKMIKRWDGIPFADGKVNGKLTVSENIADAGGISCALEAAKREKNVDLQEFFINWATIWRNKKRPEIMSMLLAVDVHAPTTLRANIPVQNLDEFYEVFDIKEGDKMYLSPEQRVSIW